MGSKKSNLEGRNREGSEISAKAIERGEQLQSEGEEIMSLLEGIGVVDEDDRRAITDAQSKYRPAFSNEFAGKVETVEKDLEASEKEVIAESSEELENVRDAIDSFNEMGRVSEVGREISEHGAEYMSSSEQDYEGITNEAQDIITETQAEVDSLRSAIDSI